MLAPRSHLFQRTRGERGNASHYPSRNQSYPSGPGQCWVCHYFLQHPRSVEATQPGLTGTQGQSPFECTRKSAPPLILLADTSIVYSCTIREPPELGHGHTRTRPQVPRKPEKDQRLTPCGRYHENDRGLTRNRTSGESDHEVFCIGDYLCFHRS